MELSLEEIKSSVAQVAKNYDIKRVNLFGSYALGTQTIDSDIDLLVEFTKPTVSYLKIIGLKMELEEITGKTVDVIHSPIPKQSYIIINKAVQVYG